MADVNSSSVITTDCRIGYICEAVHPLLASLESDVKIGLMDDLTLSRDLHTVDKDVFVIMD